MVHAVPWGPLGHTSTLDPWLILAVVVAFFSIDIGGSAYFLRLKRTGGKDLME
jgi:hypothetical protein